MSVRFDVLTLFPGIFDSFLSESVLKSAIDRKLVAVRLYNIRDWATDKHHKVDDTPYGGGPGMLLKVDRVVPCVEDVMRETATALPDKPRLLMFTPQGRRFNQRWAEELAAGGQEGQGGQGQRLVLLCGRYEGFDERVADILQPEEISVGDYVLNGGEVAAMAVIEAVMRLVPGVLGDEDSNRFDSFSSGNRLLDCAQYTRPREYRGLEVPGVLTNGNHAEIERWRNENSLERTRQKRQDLLLHTYKNER